MSNESEVRHDVGVWHALALVYGYNELIKHLREPTLGQKVYLRMASDAARAEAAKLGFEVKVDETKNPVVLTVDCPPVSLNFRESDVEAMRKFLATLDAPAPAPLVVPSGTLNLGSPPLPPGEGTFFDPMTTIGKVEAAPLVVQPEAPTVADAVSARAAFDEWWAKQPLSLNLACAKDVARFAFDASRTPAPGKTEASGASPAHWPPRKGDRAKHPSNAVAHVFTGKQRADGCYEIEAPGGVSAGALNEWSFSAAGGWKMLASASLEGMPVRTAARQRHPLGGADAQALEHAITITERERDALAARLSEVEDLARRHHENGVAASKLYLENVKRADDAERDLAASREAERSARERALEDALRRVDQSDQLNSTPTSEWAKGWKAAYIQIRAHVAALAKE